MTDSPTTCRKSVSVQRGEKWGRPCSRGDSRQESGVPPVCLPARCLVVSSRERQTTAGTAGSRQWTWGLTSADDTPLAVQYESTLRFHGTLQRHALIRNNEDWKHLTRFFHIAQKLNHKHKKRFYRNILEMECFVIDTSQMQWFKISIKNKKNEFIQFWSFFWTQWFYFWKKKLNYIISFFGVELKMSLLNVFFWEVKQSNERNEQKTPKQHHTQMVPKLWSVSEILHLILTSRTTVSL